MTAFSRAFDVYLELRRRINVRIDALLYPTPLSKYQYECPCCTNWQPEEEELDYSMLFCMDGNESLKRHQRVRRRYDTQGKETVEDTMRPDSRKRESIMYLEQEFVDKYKNEVRQHNAKVSQSRRSGIGANILLYRVRNRRPQRDALRNQQKH